eukprot:12425145-Karenia_brevis.AAC.1
MDSSNCPLYLVPSQMQQTNHNYCNNRVSNNTHINPYPQDQQALPGQEPAMQGYLPGGITHKAISAAEKMGRYCQEDGDHHF